MSVVAVNNTTTSNGQPAPTSLVAPGSHALRNPTPCASRPSTPNMPMSSKSSIPFSRMMSTVEYKNLRFIILDCPTEANLPLYKEEFKSRNVTDVVRVCEPTYNKSYFEENGIRVHDWPFKDGGVPPATLISSFLSLCDERFGGILGQKSATANGAVSGGEAEEECLPPAIAVHCVAGLGRAPILVAICLVESGMEPLDAVEYIRRRRRGALNSVQLQWLVDTYKRTWHKTSRLGGISVGTGSSSSTKYGFLKRSGSPTGTQTPPQSAAAPNGDEHGGSISSGITAVGLKEKVGKVFRFGSSKKASGVSVSVNGSPNLSAPTAGSSAPTSAGSEVEKTSGATPGSSIAV
ncbi:protein-tyrosine phosphatase-like protein [Cladochytrium replicatum]|nr:protein-tyrosine phosphatase-like protein [Cladochytrium replicatum]